MDVKDTREVWQRGPIPEIPALLQPVAHALLQAREEVEKLMAEFSSDLLWVRPANLASVGFHLQHLTGVLDRLFTYARGEGLTEEQFRVLSLEGKGKGNGNSIEVKDLIDKFSFQVDAALKQLKSTTESQLTEPREVGRAKIPTTVIGLLVHAAEHTMRHVGQLLVTVRIVKTGLIR